MGDCTYWNMERVGLVRIRIRGCLELILRSKSQGWMLDTGYWNLGSRQWTPLHLAASIRHPAVSSLRSTNCFHFPLAIKIIDQQHDDEDDQAKEFSCFFNPWFGGFHGLRNIFGIVMLYPIQHAVFVKKLISRISRIYQDNEQVSLRIKFIPKSKPAKNGAIEIDGYPYIRVRVVVLQCGGINKQQAEEQVEDFHALNIQNLPNKSNPLSMESNLLFRAARSINCVSSLHLKSSICCSPPNFTSSILRSNPIICISHLRREENNIDDHHRYNVPTGHSHNSYFLSLI